ncbi:VanW family protein [Cellulosilyticum sp. I15G10I2]|uniref:VanW family protein n=1 Tax=Cellulosilyticum sp. I15G10I2 TaxID=1892843 RepID=UPI00085C8C5E|nr:VanW family protein [Cellulosilyticum sp. I15G10I2]
MSINRTFKWTMLIVIVIISGLSIGAITYIYTKVSEFDKVFAERVLINETNISGLTRMEAYQKIQDSLNKQTENKNLVIYKGDISYKIPFSNLGSEYNMEEVLDQAYAVGHQGNLFEKYRYMKNPPQKDTVFDLKHIYDKEKIHQTVEAYSSKFHIAPIDATIERKDRQFIVTPELEGQELDLVATVEKIFTVLDSEPEADIKIEAEVNKIPAKYTSESFKDIQSIVASFTTSFNNADANRNTNLAVAAHKINTMLLPGEVFSLAKQLEPINYNSGYRASKVIVNGRLEDGIGGGICQIASTLYNSLLLTNLDITMRQNHSLPVAYVPLGRDATYATNAIDFKFKNTTDYPLFIESYCENNKVYVNLFAHPSVKSEYEIKFDSVTTEVINPPAPKYIEDPELAQGTKVEELKALSGKKVKLYKLYYKENTLVKKELVNNSYYRPRGATIRVGTRIDTPVFNPDNPELPHTNESSENQPLTPIEPPSQDPIINDSTLLNLFEEIIH